MKKKLVFLTGSGISAESGIPTFRMTANSMWESHDVREVCTHEAWLKNPNFVNEFYNMLRVKYKNAKPNGAHQIIADLEEEYDVTVITQNVDNLHEQAGSSNVLHLHGEMMKCCSEKNVEDEKQWVMLPNPDFEKELEIPKDALAADGSRLRPYIVFFGEAVPNLNKAISIIESADIFVVIGTSLQVYPAAGLVNYFDSLKQMYIIDPNKDITPELYIEKIPAIHICKTATEGMKELVEIL